MNSEISFQNTEIAFSGKTDKDLKRAYLLFRVIGYPNLMKVGKVFTQVGLKLHLPITGLIRSTIFRQFCGGENITESRETVALLGRYNVGTILDYSVEGQEDHQSMDLTTAEILDTIREAQQSKDIPFCVFKPSGVAPTVVLYKVSNNQVLTDDEKSAFEQVEARFDRICAAAHQADIPLFIDAEESWIQPAIDQLATKMMERYNTQKAIVFNTIQLYRNDRLEYLKTSFEAAKAGGYFLGEKLVRGAYLEKERERAVEKGYPSPVHDTKGDTDRDYDAAIEFCMQHLDTIAFCAGTHNEESAMLLTRLMNELNVSKTDRRVYFAQLLGMSDHITFNLSAHGYCVAKYVPYGPVNKVLPYLIRRAEENTSAQGQSGRELQLISRELERRKNL